MVKFYQVKLEDNLKKLEERFSQQRGRRGGNRRPRQQGNTQQGGE